MASLEPHKGRWYISWMEKSADGWVHKRKSTRVLVRGTRPPQEALFAFNQWERTRQEGSGALTIAAFAQEYEKRTDDAGSTKDNKVTALSRLVQYHGHGAQLKDVDPVGFVAWLLQQESKLKRPYSRATVNSYVRSLHSAFEQFAVPTHLAANPWRKQAPTVMQTAPRRIPDTEFSRYRELLDEMDQVFQALIYTIMGTGLRLGEAVFLKVGDVDLKKREATVLRSKKIHGRYEPYTVPLAKPVVAKLRPMLKRARQLKTDYVFTDGDGQPFDKKVISRRAQRLCRRAGIQRGAVHILRHRFATELLKKGAPLEAVSKLLGHQSVKTTEIYNQTIATDYADVTNLVKL